MCMDSLDKSFRAFGGDDQLRSPSTSVAIYEKYGLRGVHVNEEQAKLLNGLSDDALLFYLAFTHIDGTDGLANGVGRNMHLELRWAKEIIVGESLALPQRSNHHDANVASRSELVVMRVRRYGVRVTKMSTTSVVLTFITR